MAEQHPPDRWHAKKPDSQLLKAGERLCTATLEAERSGRIPVDDAWLDDLPNADDVALPEEADEVLAQVVK